MYAFVCVCICVKLNLLYSYFTFERGTFYTQCCVSSGIGYLNEWEQGHKIPDMELKIKGSETPI